MEHHYLFNYIVILNAHVVAKSIIDTEDNL